MDKINSAIVLMILMVFGFFYYMNENLVKQLEIQDQNIARLSKKVEQIETAQFFQSGVMVEDSYGEGEEVSPIKAKKLLEEFTAKGPLKLKAGYFCSGGSDDAAIFFNGKGKLKYWDRVSYKKDFRKADPVASGIYVVGKQNVFVDFVEEGGEKSKRKLNVVHHDKTGNIQELETFGVFFSRNKCRIKSKK